MTTDCSLNYKFNKWKFQAQTWVEHAEYSNCFWHSEQFLYTTCSPHILQKEELLTKIYLCTTNFKNQTVLSKMSPLCRTERAKAKSSKFFCKKQFWDEGCCKLAAASAVGIVTQGAISPSRFWQESKETCSIKKTLDYYWSTWIFRPSYGPVPLTACEQGCFDTFECMSFLIALLIQPT